MEPFQPQSTPPFTAFQYDVAQQQTIPYVFPPENTEKRVSPTISSIEIGEPIPPKKMYVARGFGLGLLAMLGLVLYFLWQPSSAPDAQTEQILQTTPSTASDTAAAKGAISADTSGANIQVYIAGAVQHPGVYTLDNQARVYQLLQAAGGPQPGANLAALNLATHLNDGQEIYVLRVGETPFSTTGTGSQVTKVNINTATADELRQQLSLSTTSAQAIVNYRLQHGSFTSVDTLAQVVSKTVYAKVKDMVTI